MIERPRKSRFSRRVCWWAAGLCLAMGTVGEIVAATSRTPAGTVIRNQAAVTFQRDDATGNIYQSTSNEVLIEVNAVYGISIVPDGTAAAPGQTQNVISAGTFGTRVQASFAYLLQFTGNAPDTATLSPAFDLAEAGFRPELIDGDTGFLIYSDLDADGVADSDDVLVASWRDANADGTIDPGEVQSNSLGFNYQPDETVALLVTFYVSEGLAAGVKTNVGVNGASVNDVTKTDANNVSQATVVSDAVMVVTKDADVSNVGPAGSVVFTINADNAGTSSALRRSYTVDASTYAGVLVFDVLPLVQNSGTAPTVSAAAIVSEPVGVSGTIVYANPAPTVTGATYTSWDPTDAGNWVWSTTYNAGDTVIGYISSNGTVDADIVSGEGVILQFTATVPASAIEQSLENYAYAHYTTGTIGNQTIRARNAVQFAVTRDHGVVIRDTDFEANALHSTTIVDDSLPDEQQLTETEAGTTVWFTNRVFNTSGGTDTFDILLEAELTGGGALPSGYELRLFRSDGITPLVDTGINGVVDTGPLEPAGGDLNAPLAFTDIMVQVELPDDAATLATDIEITVTARSVGNSTISDDTLNYIRAVTASSMNIANHTAPVAGPADEVAYQQNAAAGEVVDFPLIVENQAASNGSPDTYALTVPTMPSGWTVVFYRDINEDGVVDAAEIQPVLRTDETPAGGATYVIARVFVPEDALGDPDPGTAGQQPYDLTFRATSTNNPSVFDEQDDTVLLSYQDLFELRPDRQGSAEPGSVVQYVHTLRNRGERDNRFFIEVTGGHSDWVYRLLLKDATGPLPEAVDPFDSVTKPYIDLTAKDGATPDEEFILSIFVPISTPVNKVDSTFLLATANDPNSPSTRLDALPQHDVVDITRVLRGDLVLTKSVNPPESVSVSPGDTLVYTTEFFNRGSGVLTEVNIVDAIPANTSYVLSSGSTNTPGYSGGTVFEVSRNGGISWVNDSGAGSDPTVTNVRVRLLSAYLPGLTGTYEFSITIK
ncbi:MAG: hypothetical protein SynsKO_08460 [Synoicihabitans sp.]